MGFQALPAGSSLFLTAFLEGFQPVCRAGNCDKSAVWPNRQPTTPVARPCGPPHTRSRPITGISMHKVSISQAVIDRVVARRGREHIFDDLDPAKTALVVVDMQNGFMLPEVA